MNNRGKIIFKYHLSSGQVQLKFHLSCCQITLGIQGNITLHRIFYLI